MKPNKNKMDKDILEFHIETLSDVLKDEKKSLKEIQEWYRKTILNIETTKKDLKEYHKKLKAYESPLA